MLILNNAERATTLSEHQPHIAYDAFWVLECRKVATALVL
jgi:hypothetical protein